MAGRRNIWADHLFEAILEHKDRHGESPTIRELQAATGMSSTSMVVYNLKVLARRGSIEWEPKGRARAIRVVGNLASNTAQEGAQIARQVLADAEPLRGDGMDERPIHAIVSTELLDRLQRWTERVGA